LYAQFISASLLVLKDPEINLTGGRLSKTECHTSTGSV